MEPHRQHQPAGRAHLHHLSGVTGMQLTAALLQRWGEQALLLQVIEKTTVLAGVKGKPKQGAVGSQLFQGLQP